MSDFIINDGDTVVFAGDSITDCGRRDTQAPYGNGYVHQTIDLITARYPERNITYFNEGIGGNTVIDLQNRWHDYVLRHKPNVVTIKIGINDLHRYQWEPNNAVPPDVFEAGYRTILTRTKATGAKIILIDPFYLSTETDPSSNRAKALALLPDYIAVVAKLAAEFGTGRIKTHELYMKQARVPTPGRLLPGTRSPQRKRSPGHR